MTASSPEVRIDNKPLPPNAVIVRNGKIYVSLEAAAKASNGSVISDDGLVEMFTTIAPASDCGVVSSDGGQLSDEFRNAAVRIPDNIERLRPLISKHPTPAIANKLDDIDAAILRSSLFTRTEQDQSVYYALSRANNSLAIMYWKLMQQVPAEEAKRNELDSIFCSTESKFALMVGHLSGKESCSVFQRYRSKQEAAHGK